MENKKIGTGLIPALNGSKALLPGADCIYVKKSILAKMNLGEGIIKSEKSHGKKSGAEPIRGPTKMSDEEWRAERW